MVHESVLMTRKNSMEKNPGMFSSKTLISDDMGVSKLSAKVFFFK